MIRKEKMARPLLSGRTLAATSGRTQKHGCSRAMPFAGEGTETRRTELTVLGSSWQAVHTGEREMGRTCAGKPAR